MSALDKLLSLIGDVNVYDNGPDNLAELQLHAARERVKQRRGQIAVLDKRAHDTGVDAIDSFDDLVPLLFSHTNYKSYPESLVDNQRWEMMNLWLQSLSTRKISQDIDMRGVQDVDDWMVRLREAGHYVFASSGTSGKSSFLNQTEVDRERTFTGLLNGTIWQAPSLNPNADRPCYCGVPRHSPHRFSEIQQAMAVAIGAPGDIHFLTDIPTRAADTNYMGRLRTQIAQGKAAPEEVEEFERKTREKSMAVRGAITQFYDNILENRHRPIFLHTLWPYFHELAEHAAAKGIKDGDFHPDSVIMFGGGLKGAQLPEGYQQRVYDFFALPQDNIAHTYGMVEMQVPLPYSSKAEGYVVPPWVIPLVLDRDGITLLNDASGSKPVEGRMAFLDLSLEGRWGGLITGDKVSVRFDDGAPIVQSITRYQDLPEGDDKLSCAGTIDSYVRGSING